MCHCCLIRNSFGTISKASLAIQVYRLIIYTLQHIYRFIFNHAFCWAISSSPFNGLQRSHSQLSHELPSYVLVTPLLTVSQFIIRSLYLYLLFLWRAFDCYPAPLICHLSRFISSASPTQL